MARVFVGMSGGVDSSVAAKRLIERGHDVIGVFIKVWQPAFIKCDWEKERLDAMRVAAHLGIPFLTMNAEDAYKREVADYMISSYKAGLTPNPDVMCNEHVKFGAFYKWARSYGADAIATGHYAQVLKIDETYTLHKAIDQTKDQSYFLARINNEVLPHTLFPIGDTLKQAIRNEASEAGIPTAEKADSQGLCFLGQINIKDFLRHFINLERGAVLDERGNVIGEHDGALLYTLGERHGFIVTNHSDSSGPLYVSARNLERNTLTVSKTPPQACSDENISLIDIRELGHGFQDTPMDTAFRYHGPLTSATIERGGKGSGILHPQNATIQKPAAGQIAVLYAGTECCGSGIIS